MTELSKSKAIAGGVVPHERSLLGDVDNIVTDMISLAAAGHALRYCRADCLQGDRAFIYEHIF